MSTLCSGVAAGSPAQLQRVVDLAATEICHPYGLTESYGNCSATDGRLDPRDKVFTSVGRPPEGVQQRIVDTETLVPCKTGKVGEIQIKQYVTSVGTTYRRSRKRGSRAMT